MDDQLLTLLDYDGVLGALATTPDGLVVAAAGVTGDDAEIIGAAGAMLWTSLAEANEVHGSLDVESGTVHVLVGNDLSLVALSERSVPHEPLVELMQDVLDSVSALLA